MAWFGSGAYQGMHLEEPVQHLLADLSSCAPGVPSRAPGRLGRVVEPPPVSCVACPRHLPQAPALAGGGGGGAHPWRRQSLPEPRKQARRPSWCKVKRRQRRTAGAAARSGPASAAPGRDRGRAVRRGVLSGRGPVGCAWCGGVVAAAARGALRRRRRRRRRGVGDWRRRDRLGGGGGGGTGGGRWRPRVSRIGGRAGGPRGDCQGPGRRLNAVHWMRRV
jgi:hypothetical protein